MPFCVLFIVSFSGTADFVVKTYFITNFCCFVPTAEITHSLHSQRLKDGRNFVVSLLFCVSFVVFQNLPNAQKWNRFPFAFWLIGTILSFRSLLSANVTTHRTQNIQLNLIFAHSFIVPISPKFIFVSFRIVLFSFAISQFCDSQTKCDLLRCFRSFQIAQNFHFLAF